MLPKKSDNSVVSNHRYENDVWKHIQYIGMYYTSTDACFRKEYQNSKQEDILLYASILSGNAV